MQAIQRHSLPRRQLTCVGQTQGRTRQDRVHNISTPVKDIYLYALTPRFREELNHVDA